jgi:carbonic anhydrase
MRLFEAIIEANHRAAAGDQHAGLHPAEFQSELPVVALTCIDVRLNPLLPEVLGLPESQFIWLRNAGNVITSTLSSTMRSLALACAIKGGKEIAIIGHTDCLVGKTTTMELIERLSALGVQRHLLPPNVNEFFGTFSSERTNVIKGVDFVRQSPLIGPKIPVHGLLVDIETGRVEWLVNGYQTLDTMAPRREETAKPVGHTLDAFKPLGDFEIGEMKFPAGKIGEAATQAVDWLSGAIQAPASHTQPAAPTAKSAAPPKIPVPRPVRPRLRLFKGPNEYKGSK